MAVDVLIMAISKTHLSDSEKARRTLWRRGDIVDVFPGGKLGPHAHAGGKFAVVTIDTPMTPEEFKEKYMTPHYAGEEGKEENTIYQSRSRYQFIPEELSSEKLTDFESRKRLTLNSLSEFTPYLEDKILKRRANLDLL